MRVLKFRIVSPREFETGITVTPPCYLTAIFQNGSRTLTVVYQDVFPGPLVEVYKATDFEFSHVPVKFTEETVREFVDSHWYVAA